MMEDCEATAIYALDLDDLEPTRVRPSPRDAFESLASAPRAPLASTADTGGAHPVVIFTTPSASLRAAVAALVVSAVATLGVAATVAMIFAL
jgi:hypothetical protein